MTDTTNKPGLPTVEQVAAHERDHGGRWRWNAPGKVPCFYCLGVIDGEVWISWQDDGTPCMRLDALEQGTLTPCDQQGNPLGLVDSLVDAERRSVRYAKRAVRAEAWKVGSILEIATQRARLSQAARRVLELGRQLRRLRSSSRVQRLAELSCACASAEEERDAWKANAEKATRDMEDERARRHDAEEALRSAKDALKACRGAYDELERDRNAWRETAQRAAACNLDDYKMLRDPSMPEGQALRALVRAARDWVAPSLSTQDLAGLEDSDVNGAVYALRRGKYPQAAGLLAVLLARRELAQATVAVCSDDEGANAAAPVGEETAALRGFMDAYLSPVRRYAAKARATVETCGECRFCERCWMSPPEICSAYHCRHPEGPEEDREIDQNASPPGDCPGPEPRSEKGSRR